MLQRFYLNIFLNNILFVLIPHSYILNGTADIKRKMARP